MWIFFFMQWMAAGSETKTMERLEQIFFWIEFIFRGSEAMGVSIKDNHRLSFFVTRRAALLRMAHLLFLSFFFFFWPFHFQSSDARKKKNIDFGQNRGKKKENKSMQKVERNAQETRFLTRVRFFKVQRKNPIKQTRGRIFMAFHLENILKGSSVPFVSFFFLCLFLLLLLLWMFSFLVSFLSPPLMDADRPIPLRNREVRTRRDARRCEWRMVTRSPLFRRKREKKRTTSSSVLLVVVVAAPRRAALMVGSSSFFRERIGSTTNWRFSFARRWFNLRFGFCCFFFLPRPRLH